MIEHDVIPAPDKTAFWSVSCVTTPRLTQYHAALIDLLSGHTLWAITATCRLDPAMLRDITERFEGYGWTIEPLA